MGLCGGGTRYRLTDGNMRASRRWLLYKKTTVGLAVIGDEVLTGEVADENLHWIATRLFAIGAELAYAAVLPDRRPFLVEHLGWMRGAFDWVITTGGIGATHDDVTRQTVADVLGVPLEENPVAVGLLEKRVGGALRPRVREMAMLPRGAELVLNPLTAAPGFVLQNIVVLPGIPRLVQAMFPALEERLAGAAWFRSEISTSRYESEIADLLERAQELYPEVRIGSYPIMMEGGFRVKLVLRSHDREQLDRAAAYIDKGI